MLNDKLGDILNHIFIIWDFRIKLLLSAKKHVRHTWRGSLNLSGNQMLKYWARIMFRPPVCQSCGFYELFKGVSGNIDP